MDAALNVVTSREDIRQILQEHENSKTSTIFGKINNNSSSIIQVNDLNPIRDLNGEGTAMVMNIEMNKEMNRVAKEKTAKKVKKKSKK